MFSTYHTLYQIYADRIKIVLPSDEPVDVRTVKNIDFDGAEKRQENHDSDEEILKCFDNVAVPIKQNSSDMSRVADSSATKLRCSIHCHDPYRTFSSHLSRPEPKER